MREVIQRYNEKTGELEVPMAYKVKRILDLECLVKIGTSTWECRPIAGYNSTTYTIAQASPHHPFTCTCQGYRKRNTCSHVDALRMKLKDAPEQMEMSWTR